MIYGLFVLILFLMVVFSLIDYKECRFIHGTTAAQEIPLSIFKFTLEVLFLWFMFEGAMFVFGTSSFLACAIWILSIFFVGFSTVSVALIFWKNTLKGRYLEEFLKVFYKFLLLLNFFFVSLGTYYFFFANGLSN